MRQRLPLLLSAVALTVALLGATPLGQAAATVVKRALYANNAGKVNGIKASRKPQPGKLLALGSNGKFPASVGAIGQPGPKGDTGPPGPKGDKGDTGPVAGVSASAPLASSGGSSPNISIAKASASTDGYLSKGDWSAFNNTWRLGGNAGTNPSSNFLGTTDSTALNLAVGGARTLRLEPGGDINFPDSPNVIGGYSGNSVAAGVSGATIGGGGEPTAANSVSARFGTVAGGVQNTVGSGGVGGSVAGGALNTASSTDATVPGGYDNTASGAYSFAGGYRAKAMGQGTFVWADDNAFDFNSTGTNSFTVRATGGARFVSGIDSMGNANAGVILLSGGGSWGNLSDRAAKTNFANVDSDTILARLAGIPIQSWNYKAQRPSIRHLGPMAQDFRRAFGLGEDNRYIDTLDAEGVALAGIQGLYKLSLSEQRQLAEQQREIHTLQRELRALRTG